MAQHRQSVGSFFPKVGLRNDDVSLGIRAPKQTRTAHPRRFRARRISVRACILVIIALIFLISASAFLFLSNDDKGADKANNNEQSDEFLDFLANVTRIERSKVLKFGRGHVKNGRDSRYWDRDDRRRDEDYGEDLVEHNGVGDQGGSVSNGHMPLKRYDSEQKLTEETKKRSDHKVAGLYNEAGRHELKMYEAEYEASLDGVVQNRKEAKNINHLRHDTGKQNHNEEDDADDEYNEDIDMHDIRLEDYNTGLDNDDHSDVGISGRGSLTKDHIDGDITDAIHEFSDNASLDPLNFDKIRINSRHVNVVKDQALRKSTSERMIATKKRSKRRKFSGSCEMKILNSTTQLVEPLESRKFARFSLDYTEQEENLNELEPWEPRFAGHQTLEQREQSFLAHDQKINCGFVKGPKGSLNTGFDLAEDDVKYVNSCHIAVISCIFGNSDRLRSPMGKTVSHLSRRSVCFVMFVDDATLQTLSSEGHTPDRMGYVGLWKIVLVKNLPYTDMRRVGKIPKLLAHRLFPFARSIDDFRLTELLGVMEKVRKVESCAFNIRNEVRVIIFPSSCINFNLDIRYSIWLDSKLRLQVDPLLVLEYFLWRKGHEYAISNHYDRHCVWEEVAQNKKLNKYNHTIIDEQFAFYQSDGLTRFNPMDPQKLLPSNVPEGSFIVRAHTPMSNLFSCLWFNEVERFTPRDQLSFAYTYQKLRRMNPTKPFYFSMFKDCERRKIAKLFRHRSEERRYINGQTQ